ncbi:hypothetical protein Hamer_G004985 [Homarus americanus]|uniref:Uncharacterized protein n=1 Tax=Homarus americanus TaxID=6706 RepID=A0A8J5MU91_HOMAM|nr:hypothetical protein Hamer_G004985 [Homarus americanus]
MLDRGKLVINAKQLSGEIKSARADVKEGEESDKVSQVPATTWYGTEREEVPAQTQDATHPDGSENAV